jgi:hypothetical protein
VDLGTPTEAWAKGEWCRVIDGDPTFEIAVPKPEPVAQPRPPLTDPWKAPPVGKPACNVIRNLQHAERRLEEEADEWELNPPRNTHDGLCEKIKDMAEQISTSATNLSIERSISRDGYNILIESLEQTLQDLEGTYRML